MCAFRKASGDRQKSTGWYPFRHNEYGEEEQNANHTYHDSCEHINRHAAHGDARNLVDIISSKAQSAYKVEHVQHKGKRERPKRLYFDTVRMCA